MLIAVHDYSFVSVMDSNFIVKIMDSGVVLVEGGGGFTGTLDDIPDGVNRLAMVPAERTKLAGISAGATVNSTDAQLRDRATHTGTQTAATISNFNASADARITVQKGVALGLVPLDAATKIDITYMPDAVLGAANYRGTWNATTNTPALASGVGTKGYYYKVSVAGTTTIDGINDWAIGDWIIYNGTTWDKIDNTDSVSTVNGKVGIVVLTTTDIAEGTNLYFTTERAQDSVGAAFNATLLYNDGANSMGINLGNANTWTAAQSVPDDAYAGSWNGSVEVPTKNAVYDKIELIDAAKPDKNLTVNTQTASYVLVLSDKDKIVEMNVATANTLTVPPNSSVSFPVGAQIIVNQIGAGQTTVTAGAGVTIRVADTLKMAKQWAGGTLYQRATDEWVLLGYTAAT